jgi:hypothetical protein
MYLQDYDPNVFELTMPNLELIVEINAAAFMTVWINVMHLMCL